MNRPVPLFLNLQTAAVQNQPAIKLSLFPPVALSHYPPPHDKPLDTSQDLKQSRYPEKSTPLLELEMTTTPPSHPNFQVHLSDATIKSLVDKSLAGVDLGRVSVGALASGKSFNNRIYFVDLGAPADISRPKWTASGAEPGGNARHITTSSLVLKIAGNPFGLTKIQNEIASLLLLEKYTPSIPVPRVIAWSEDGQRIKTPFDVRGYRDRAPSGSGADRAPTRDEQGNVRESDSGETHNQGWILITRVPGRLLTAEDLAGPFGEDIMRQIAGHVATWRKQLPLGRAVGNMRLIRSSSTPPPWATLLEKATLPGLDIYIDGLITVSERSVPLTSALKYTTHVLREMLRRLKSGKIYKDNREHISVAVRRFIKETLPKLPLLSHADERMVFTHYDLSPRNMLVSSSTDDHPHGPSLALSGIVDLEFAGFYPENEEFANTVENNGQEWPAPLYALFLAELERLDALPASLARSPAASQLLFTRGKAVTAGIPFGGSEFHQAVLLVRVIENIAPWWVKGESGMSDYVLQRTLQAVREKVDFSIAALQNMVDKGGQDAP